MRIAILSRNGSLYSTKRLVDAVQKRGHQALLIDPLMCNIELDQNGPRIFYKNENLTDIRAIIPRIGASITFYGTAVVRQFEAMNVFTVVSSDGLSRSRDKLRSLQILSMEGIKIPRTVFTNYPKNVKHILDSVGGTPVILKLLEGTQGLGVVLAESENAATSVLEAFNGLKARVIVQEFVKESRAVDIRAFVVGNRVVGAMRRQGKEGEFRSNLHRGGSSQVVSLSKEEEAMAVKAAKILGLGVAGVDMLQSNKGPLIIEVNSSPGLEGIEGATGMDIAGAIVQYVEENYVKPVS